MTKKVTWFGIKGEGSNQTSYNLRTRTIEPAAKTTYTPFPGVEEEIVGTAITRRVTYSLGGQAVALRVQIVNGTNTLHYLHSDHLGSTRLMSDSNGDPVNGSTTRYYPFGDWRTEPTANLTDRGYTGHQHNNTASNDLGLIYMNARYYLPGTGRFASADTVTPDPANPQAFNRYSYTYNNPLAYTDPDGHDPYWCGSGQCMQNYNNSMANSTVAPGTAAYNVEVSGKGYGKDLNAYDQHPWSTPYWQHLENGTLTVPEGMTAKEYVAQLVIADIVNSLQNDKLPTTLTNLLAGAEMLDLFYQAFVVADDTTAQAYAYAHAPGDLLDELPCSFAADTPVATIDGLQPISQLESGTLVLAYNEATNTVGYYSILAVWEHEDPIILFLTIDGEVVETTPNHPFYTVEGEWVPAGDLQLGDQIRNATGEAGLVQHIVYQFQWQTMYNLTVATANTYFVGNEQWLVHNVNCHWDAQGKHIPGHKNYIPGRSTLTHPDPQDLLDNFAGTGNPLRGTQGQPGYREWVDFGTEIGTYVNPTTGITAPTTTGVIHYSGRGAHIVPARPLTQ